MRETLAMQGNPIGCAVKSHVQGSRSRSNGINRATAGACRKLNYVGEAASVNTDCFILRLNWTAIKLIRHIINLLFDSRRVSLDQR